MNFRKVIVPLLFFLPAITIPAILAQDRVGQVFVRVTTDDPDWTYSPGQPVTFHIAAAMDGHPLSGVEVEYRVGPEMIEPAIVKTVTLPAEGIDVEAGTMKEPGFLRCIATAKRNNRTYRGVATAGFDPLSIRPVGENPADFEEFWNEARQALAGLPIDARLTLLPDYCTSTVNTYHVSLQNVGTDGGPSRFYGILCEPKADGKYPALLNVPGAGVRPYRGLVSLAEQGMITLQVGIHGLPVILDPAVYDSLGRGALNGYPTFGLDSRDRYYYRRVYLGCLRGNDFLVRHPKFDGKNLGVTGGSQGGALSIVVAGLDSRVTGLAAYYPALCDLTGYLKNRAGGWPHMFRRQGEGSHRSPDKIQTSYYYDVVNFARRVKAPGLYIWGFNDETCPPTSMYSAYNFITAQKSLLLAFETGHNTLPEETDISDQWLIKTLNAKGNQ
ncbi:MAG: acetylxylan esterase [Acidobacteria bacterium]|nr:MAG: acetylxylan esterase [Acidobacteriota bacterium]